MVDRFERFTYDICRIYRVWHQIASEAMEEYGLKGPHTVYITTLYHCPEGLTATQMRDLSSRDKSDVSRAINQLTEKGLIRRVGGGKSLYRSRIVLTEKGRELAVEVNAKVEMAVERGSQGLSGNDREGLYRALELVAANLERFSKEGFADESYGY